MGTRGRDAYEIRDDQAVLSFFAAHSGDEPSALVAAACRRADFWGSDLSELPGFAEAVTAYLTSIQTSGAGRTMQDILAQTK